MKYLPYFVLVFFLNSCATLIRGTTQQISLNTDPVGATATLSDGRSCLTPCTLEAQRKNTVQIYFEKNGCNSTSTAMVPTLAGAGAILGGLIDYGTGAVYDLQPNPLFVKLTCNGRGGNQSAERRSLCIEAAKKAKVPQGAIETDHRLYIYQICLDS